MSEQLALGIGPDRFLTFDNFYVVSANRLLVNQLGLQARGEGEQWVMVHGAAESGRSHLLQAACQAASADGKIASYLPLKDMVGYSPDEILAGAETLDLLCLDDVDAVLGKDNWEEALFHLYNRASLSGTSLLLSSARPAGSLDCNLPDLRSRLTSFSVYQAHSLDEEQRLQALVFRAEGLGMELSPDVAEYLYHRAARNLSTLFDILDQLDRESLRHQRALTKPFVKSVMGW
ncbi:DnaA family protein [Litorivivens lipolytica]|uniref:DnaA family protein n=1 Tax=Litorivivens lipolytica TaxID=1524264 RepID=A0A7W4Z623_9GAMM|nr:DnaA regulatory inactivator Hda [Litorivivens lipolytica]MBB3047732.1 DnaA family protein [Litorivivens lipolytica]